MATARNPVIAGKLHAQLVSEALTFDHDKVFLSEMITGNELGMGFSGVKSGY